MPANDLLKHLRERMVEMETTEYPKLKPEVKKAWLKALRRKKNPFKQGQRRLKDSGRYCCLGVYCEISGLAGLEFAGFTDYQFVIDDIAHGYSGVIPLDWAAINMFVPESAGIQKALDLLVNFNDIQKWSFTKIASWIDKNL